MTHLKQQLKDEINRFQTIVTQYQNKETTAEELYNQFHHLGVYPQSTHNQFTLRLFTLCGILSIDQLQFLSDIIDRYQIPHLHFTTGQNIHLHNLSVGQISEIMLSALEHNLFSGTIENLPLHIGLSPLSGVLPTESFDPTPHAVLISDYFSKNEQISLQNSYKIAFSNSIQDTAFATVSDVGFITTLEDEKPFFKLYLAGGFHHHIIPAIAFPELIEPSKTLLYALAYIHLIESLCADNNKPCAVIKDMDEQTFLSQYQSSLNAMKLKQDLPTIMHTPDITELMPNSKLDLQELNCLFSQKQEGLFCVLIHPANGILESTHFTQLVDTIKDIPNAEIRLGFNSSLYLVNLSLEQANTILQNTKEILQQTKVKQSISCTGLPTCPNGKVQCQQVLFDIVEYLKQHNVTHNHLPCICISGCENSCTRHEVGYIGLEGKTSVMDGQPREAFDVYIGGRVSNEKTTCGTNYGVMLASQVPKFIYQLALVLEKAEMDFPTYYHSNTNEFDSLIKPFLFS